MPELHHKRLLPPDGLTAKEADWWDWATGALENALGDPDFVRDNPDRQTLASQRSDILYRIGVQAPDMAKGSPETGAEHNGTIRVLNSLYRKLTEAWT